MSVAPTRRDFIRTMGTGLAAAGTAASALACAPPEDPTAGTSGASERLLVRDPDHVTPAPVGVDRLPLEWHQARVRELKSRLADTRARAIVLGRDQDMVYFTGCFRGSGERSTWAVLRPDEEDTVYWYARGSTGTSWRRGGAPSWRRTSAIPTPREDSRTGVRWCRAPAWTSSPGCWRG